MGLKRKQHNKQEVVTWHDHRAPITTKQRELACNAQAIETRSCEYSMRRAGIHRPRGLLPRCRLFLSWHSSMCQGWGCSPIKKERELGLDRRETGRILSSRAAGWLMVTEDQYERNILWRPLVYRLSDRAPPGSHAVMDKR